ncbi:hypothetical protein HK104_005631 [Borealophlyctis nickersoniae]|nr:hypothetical protein HK104_005631 [Borealophlyctis nickersoniae]
MTPSGRPDSRNRLPSQSTASMVFESPIMGHPVVGGVCFWHECAVINVSEEAERWIVVAEVLCGGEGRDPNDLRPLLMSTVMRDADPKVIAEMGAQYKRDSERDTVIVENARSGSGIR